MNSSVQLWFWASRFEPLTLNFEPVLKPEVGEVLRNPANTDEIFCSTLVLGQSLRTLNPELRTCFKCEICLETIGWARKSVGKSLKSFGNLLWNHWNHMETCLEINGWAVKSAGKPLKSLGNLLGNLWNHLEICWEILAWSVKSAGKSLKSLGNLLGNPCLSCEICWEILEIIWKSAWKSLPRRPPKGGSHKEAPTRRPTQGGPHKEAPTRRPPQGTRRHQDAPGGPRRHQEATGGTRRPQEAPGGTRRHQEAPRRHSGDRLGLTMQICMLFATLWGLRCKSARYLQHLGCLCSNPCGICDTLEPDMQIRALFTGLRAGNRLGLTMQICMLFAALWGLRCKSDRYLQHLGAFQLIPL